MIDKKLYSVGPNALYLIEAIDAAGETVLFERGSIASLRPAGEGESKLALQDGTACIIKKPFDDLKSLIYFNTDAYPGGLLDLKENSQPGALPAPPCAETVIKEEFSAVAAKKNDLIIQADFRIAQNRQYLELSLHGRDIDWEKCESRKSMVTQKPGTEVVFKPGITHAGSSELMLDMPKDTFEAAVQDALKRELPVLKLSVKVPMMIEAIVRQPYTAVCMPFTFPDTEILWDKVEKVDRGYNGKKGFTVHLSKIKGPFTSICDHFVIDMNIDDFSKKYNQAKLKGAPVLDIKSETKPGKKRWFGR